jgi:hypothetical protein
MTFQKLFTILACLVSLIALFATTLMADGEKAPLPAPPESQQECDQMEPKAASSSVSSPRNPATENEGIPDPFIQSSLKNQESPESGG